MNFTLKKNKPKKRKKISEIKININNNTFIKGKTITKVFKINSVQEVYEILNNIAPNVKLKLLINYNENKFYIFKTKHIKKKKSSSNLDSNNLNDSNLNNEELASLLKSFYSNKKFQWDNSFLKKSNKLKYEIAPSVFEVKDNYLLSENTYINVISLEHLGNDVNIKNIIQNNNCWLALDCYKVDANYILTKINEMKKDKVIEKKFSDFISNKIDDILFEIKKETIFQCELKLLLYNSNLEQLNEKSSIIREKLLVNNCTSYSPQERLNTRKLFEKCIYPNIAMDIIHSIIDKDLYKMIGCDN